MNYLIGIRFILLLLPSLIFSQKIYSVDYQSQSKGNEGLWHFVDYPSQSDKKVYFVDYESLSDLKVFFVKYRSQSGWRNKSKKHLLH